MTSCRIDFKTQIQLLCLLNTDLTTATLIPAFNNMPTPLPATLGLGSKPAINTLLTPELINASAQGGVFPVWLQGSKVT